ncbi:MAG: hypothetical protein LBK99_25580 [Opitutaceae bacterium]|jgi:hypothetical protein|nr:hypothetical protein [Opitutaceae bacterium]
MIFPRRLLEWPQKGTKGQFEKLLFPDKRTNREGNANEREYFKTCSCSAKLPSFWIRVYSRPFAVKTTFSKCTKGAKKYRSLFLRLLCLFAAIL